MQNIVNEMILQNTISITTRWAGFYLFAGANSLQAVNLSVNAQTGQNWKLQSFILNNIKELLYLINYSAQNN